MHREKLKTIRAMKSRGLKQGAKYIRRTDMVTNKIYSHESLRPKYNESQLVLEHKNTENKGFHMEIYMK